eukprot:gene11250-biopygen4979
MRRRVAICAVCQPPCAPPCGAVWHHLCRVKRRAAPSYCAGRLAVGAAWAQDESSWTQEGSPTAQPLTNGERLQSKCRVLRTLLRTRESMVGYVYVASHACVHCVFRLQEVEGCLPLTLNVCRRMQYVRD